MANEILFSTLSGNARVSAVLHQTILEKLTDKTSLVNHPFILNFGNLNGSGSSALQVPVVGLGGYNAMAAVADGSAASNTAITSAAATITIARQALVRQISDLAQLTANGPMNVTIEALADDMVGAFNKRVTTMLGGLSSGFSTSVGSTGVNLSVTTFYDAIFALTLQSNDSFMALLHPQQMNDLISSLRAETAGPGPYMAATHEQVSAKPPGYRGTLYGVEIYTSATAVPTANAGADYLGMMFSKGAIGYATGSAAPVRGAADVVLPAGTPIVVEVSRSPEAGLSTITGSAFVGVAELDDLRGVGILSDF